MPKDHSFQAFWPFGFKPKSYLPETRNQVAVYPEPCALRHLLFGIPALSTN